MKFISISRGIAVALLLLVSTFCLTAQAKPADPVSGKWEGVARSDQMGEISVAFELKNDGGKLSGTIESAQGSFPITGGTYADGKIGLKFDAGGNEGVIDATLAGDKISGKWELSGQGGTLELKKVAAKPSTDAPKAAADPISGEWSATAEAQGMTLPFTLKLKLDGDKVSGTSESQSGVASVKGTWKDGKLSLNLDSQQGSILLNAVLRDGKLVGDYDFSGQMSGKWEASKK